MTAAKGNAQHFWFGFLEVEATNIEHDFMYAEQQHTQTSLPSLSPGSEDGLSLRTKTKAKAIS